MLLVELARYGRLARDESTHRRTQFAPELAGEAHLLTAGGVHGRGRGFGQSFRFERSVERGKGRELGRFQPPRALTAEAGSAGLNDEENSFIGLGRGR